MILDNDNCLFYELTSRSKLLMYQNFAGCFPSLAKRGDRGVSCGCERGISVSG